MRCMNYPIFFAILFLWIGIPGTQGLAAPVHNRRAMSASQKTVKIAAKKPKQKSVSIRPEQQGRMKAQTARIAELEKQIDGLRLQLQQSQALSDRLAAEVLSQRKKTTTDVFLAIAGTLVVVGGSFFASWTLRGRLSALLRRLSRVKSRRAPRESDNPFDAVIEPGFDDKLSDFKLADFAPDEGVQAVHRLD